LTDANCNGSATGSIDLVVTGGTTPYTYLWSTGATSEDLSGLTAGTYTVTVTDAQGCTDEATFTIDEPTTLEIDLTATVLTDADCNGSATGAIDLVVTGGTAPYGYLWSTGATSEDLSGLTAGTYTVTVTDAQGCTDEATFTIDEPTTLEIDLTATVLTDADCNGSATGSIDLVVTGGTTPYTYLWSTGATSEDLSGLTAGTYTVTVTDALGCTDEATFTIEEPTTLEIDITATVLTDADCNGSATGAIDLVVTGGTTPYTYLWSTGATSEDLSGLTADTYTVTVTDAQGCTDEATFTIEEPTTLEIDVDATVLTDADCNGSATGSIDLVVTGGTTPYTYLWSTGATSEDLSGLAAGTYTVTVTDALGCTDEATFTIDEPTTLEIDLTATVLTDADCNGAATGSIDLVVTGGTLPYTYLWSTGATSEDLSGLTAGTYTVTVTDAQGCTDEATFTIDEPTTLEIDIDATVLTDADCNGAATGSIDLVVTGGTLPYTYLWNTGATSEDLNGLTAGTYTVTVTDAQGCTDEATFTIEEPTTLEIDITATVLTDADCNGSATGAIDLVVTGGTTPYTYLWSTGATSEDLTGLTAGTYTVTVTDAQGCTDEATFTIDEPTTLEIDIDATVLTDADCNGSATGAIDLVVTGGTTPYTYLWNTGATSEDLSGLTAGTYTVTVTDAQGCTDEATFIITQPDAVAIDVAGTVVQAVDCNGFATGSIFLVVIGGTPDYTYAWSGPVTIGDTNNATGLTAGTYSVTVTDANGCTDVASFEVTQPAPLLVSNADVNNTSCDSNDGSITLTIEGGTPNYTVSWDNGMTGAAISDLTPGTYTATIEDANGCTLIQTYSIERNCFDLALIKTVASAGPFVPGAIVNFNIQVINQGNIDATQVEITDYIPTQLSLVGTGWSQSGNLATRTIALLPAGQSTTLTISLQIDANYGGGDLINYAEISSADNALGLDDADSEFDQTNNDPGGLPNSPADDYVLGNGTGAVNSGNAAGDADDHDPAMITVTALVDLSLTKTVDNTTPFVGDQVIYTLTLANAGPALATGIVVEDVLPTGLSYVSHNGGNYNSTTGAWTITSLASGGNITLQITATVEAVGNYNNCAQVLAQDQQDVDSTPGNAATQQEDDNDCAPITPQAVTDLSLEKTASVTMATAGDPVTFTLTLNNAGPSTATGITISEQIPSGFIFNGSTASGGSYDPANGVWTVNSLAAGETVTLNIEVTVAANGEYCNEAFVATANEFDVDSTPGNGVDTDGDGQTEDDPGDEDDGDAVCIEVPCQVILTLVQQTECNDNGTPTDPNDDFINVTILVEGINTSAGWTMTTNRGQVFTGTYGNSITIPLLILNQEDETAFITVTDNGDNGCTNGLTITMPEGSCSEDCLILAEISTLPYCDDNGTPSDPSDDVYYLEVTVAGQNIGGDGWFAVDGQNNLFTGNYNQPKIIGPYTNFGGNTFNVLFRDVENPTCGQFLLPVTPPQETCSDACAISIAVLQPGPICDPNGTPIDPSDDVYYVFVQINGINGSFAGWETDDEGWTAGEGEYGGTFEFGPYPANQNHTITVRDASDPDCEVSIPIIATGPCDVGCELTINTFAPVCNDNGTPFDPTDDTYTFGVRIVPAGPDVSSTGWRFVNGNGNFTPGGAYNQIITLGPFPIPANGADTTFQIADNGFISCRDAFTITPPAPCSMLSCNINAQEVAKRCDNNGTPFDPSDDVFYFTLQVNGNTSTGWTVTTPAGTTGGAYGQSIEIGPFPVGQDVTFTVSDLQYPAECNQSLTVTTTEACEEERTCMIEVQVIQDFDDLGTPLDYEDDEYDITFLVTNGGQGGDYRLVIFNGPTLIGTFGQPLVLENYTANQDISFTITDLQDEDCSRIGRVFGQTVLGNYTWIDTDGDGIQDPGEEPLGGVQVILSGLDLETGLPVNEDMVTSADGRYLFTDLNQGLYSVTFVLPGGYTYTLLNQGTEVLDSDADPAMNGMTASLPLSTPLAYLDLDAGFVPVSDCDISVVESTTTCIDNDFFQVVIQLDGIGANGWTATDNVLGTPQSGTFATSFEQTYSTQLTGPIVITFADADDENCLTTVSIDVPSDCVDPPPCAITITSQVFDCNDMGTPEAADDTFSAFFAATGTNTGDCFTYNLNGEALTGTYGIPIFLNDLLVANGNVVIDVVDCNSPDCTVQLTLVTPAPCSQEECQLTLGTTSTTCEGDNFTVSIPVTAVAGTSWVAIDNNGDTYNGAYGENFVAQYPVSLTNSVLLTFFDAADPSCLQNISIDVPEDCISDPCMISASTEVLPCNDQGTPNDADDIYTATFVVTGNGTAACFNYEFNGTSFSGNYGETITLENLLVTAGSFDLMITDCEDTSCTTSETITPPSTCSEPCALTVSSFNFGCEGVGTGSGADDVFSGLFNVSGANVGTCYTYTINGETFVGTYGQPVLTGPFLISAGNVTIDIVDCNSDICATQVVFIAPLPCSVDTGCAIECPGNVDAVALGLACGDLDQILNNPASLSLTGEPTLSGDDCLIVETTFVDEVISEEGCNGVTILRTFSVTYGPGNPYTCTQLISISDSAAPEVSCAPTNFFDEELGQDLILFPVDVFECTATIEVPYPTVTDACGSGWSVVTELTTLNGTVLTTIGTNELRFIPDLGIGDYLLRYYVTDDCGNAAAPVACRIRVTDQDPPTAICVSGINVSVGAFGLARIYTPSVDNGSYDDCDLDRIEIRRMYTRDPATCDTLLTPTYSDWGNYVDFNCCDAGLYVTVELRVVDLAGNADTCWTEVLVRDNTLPFCTSLFNETVTCDELPAGFDPYSTTDLAARFGSPEVVDNCSAEAIELPPVVNLSDCGAGTIVRRFVAIDRVGNESASIFEQLITIEYILNYNIRFPKDEITNCFQEIPAAEAFNVGCDSITVDYVDTQLTVEGNECFYIARTYTVTNWCEWNGIDPPQVISRDEDCDGVGGEENVWVLRRPTTAYVDRDAFHNNTNPTIGERGQSCTGTLNPLGYWRETTSTGQWQYTQRIKIFDNAAPVVQFTAPAPICTDSTACEVMVDLPFTVTEYCLPDAMTFTIGLDLSANGTVDQILQPAEVLYGDGTNYGIRALLPLGSHRMQVGITDGCGNTTNIVIPFQIVDCYIPEPNCFTGLNAILQDLPAGTDINGDGEMDAAGLLLFANQLASCNILECNLPLRFSVNREGEMPNMNQESIGLTCDDRPGVRLEVYVWDGAYNPYSVQPDGSLGGPNYTMCVVDVNVLDTEGHCNDCVDGDMTVGGDIYTMNSEAIAGVEVKLESTILLAMMTESEGRYEFEDLPAGEAYVIRPYKNDDTPNGISTLDMIRIQNHLLGVQMLTNPYLLIAADVNNSGSVTTLDLIQLRRLILGEISTFANNTSWRFVPADYVFPNPENPWSSPFPEWITVDALDGCLYAQNFMGIKIGDINGSANAALGGLHNGDERSSLPAWNLLLEDTKVKAGQTYRLALMSTELDRVEGFQFTLDCNEDQLEILDVEEGLLRQDNWGKTLQARGLLTVSWERSGVLPRQDRLLTLVVRAKASGQIADWITLSPRYTMAEAYERSVDNRVMDIELGYFGQASTGMALYQNIPNPVTAQTVIPFDLPEDGTAIIEIHDISGRRILTIRDEFTAGSNEVRIKAGQLPNGLYSYTLRFGGQQLSRKMIVAQ
jgi:uncharacterized repeat protein (TIGR01451 family)